MTTCLYGETWSHIFCSFCQLFTAKVSFNTFCVVWKHYIISTNNIFIYSFRIIMPVLGSWYTFIWEKNTLIKNWIFISPCRFFLLLFKYMNFLLCTTILYPIFYPEKFFQLGASPDSKTRTSVWLVRGFHMGSK